MVSALEFGSYRRLSSGRILGDLSDDSLVTAREPFSSTSRMRYQRNLEKQMEAASLDWLESNSQFMLAELDGEKIHILCYHVDDSDNYDAFSRFNENKSTLWFSDEDTKKMRTVPVVKSPDNLVSNEVCFISEETYYDAWETCGQPEACPVGIRDDLPKKSLKQWLRLFRSFVENPKLSFSDSNNCLYLVEFTPQTEEVFILGHADNRAFVHDHSCDCDRDLWAIFNCNSTKQLGVPYAKSLEEALSYGICLTTEEILEEADLPTNVVGLRHQMDNRSKKRWRNLVACEVVCEKITLL